MSTIKGRDQYMILTMACGIIAFLSCGLVFFFPFREQKANKSSSSNQGARSFHGSNLTFKLISDGGDPQMSHLAHARGSSSQIDNLLEN